MGGGGGGDNGYQAQQAATEARKQAARDALNVQFGVGPSTMRVAQPVESTGSSIGDAIGEAGQTGKGFAAPTYSTQVETGSPANAAARDSLYQTVRDNAFGAGKRQLDEQKLDAARKLKFELFAKGQNGGSTDIDQNALLGRTYDKGIIDLGGKADAAKAQFRGDDESTRLSLLQSIDGGMDQGSALTSAINQLGVNSDRAAATAQGTSAGDLFANSALLYNTSQAAKGKQAGLDAWQMFANQRKGAGLPTAATSGVVYNGPGV